MKTALLFGICVIALSHLINGRAIEEEIYNGYNARKGQFPYQVLLISQSKDSGGRSFCGGSLISTRYVLTAAHCAYRINQTTVYVGLTDTADGTGVTTYVVPEANHMVHESYNTNNLQNDIAVLKLPTAVTTNQYVSTIALPKKSQSSSSTFDNQMATASGWGQTQDNSSGIARILQYRTVNVYQHSRCAYYYRYVNTVTDGMICTDKRVVYSGPCRGDSGGPLTVNGTDGRPMVIGAVSWGVGNCSSSNPVVFTNVPYYLDWISSKTGIAVS